MEKTDLVMAEPLLPSPAPQATLEEFSVTELEERLEFLVWCGNGHCGRD
jgi:hypothetical protein